MLIKRIFIISLIAVLTFSYSANGQKVSDLLISEVKLSGDPKGIIDEYGNRVGWIELYNTSQGIINFSGYFLSNDRNNLKKHIIPKGDFKTKLGPRQAIILYATGNETKGTLYLNFSINRGETIYLTSTDGKTIVDSLYISNNLPTDKSISKIPLNNKHTKFGICEEFTHPTPGFPNGEVNNETKSQRMEREDPYGIILSIVAIVVVFTALTLLWLLFASLFSNKKKKKNNNNADNEVAMAIAMALDSELSEEVYAAVGAALHQYRNDIIHDEESFVITIKHNPNSNWNNKIQNFRKTPRK